MKGFVNCNVYIEEKGIQKCSVGFEDGKIAYIGNDPLGIEPLMELSEEQVVVPGFIDEHIHGAGGSDAMDGTQKDLAIIAETIAQEGTTTFLATTMTQSKENILKAMRAVKDYRAANGEKGARNAGVHLEGPFISAAHKGAQPLEYVAAPSAAVFDEYNEASGNCIKIITLAPEEKGALDFIRHLVNKGVTVSIGHSGATCAQVCAAMQAGATNVTHTYNAQSALHHREIGVVGAGFLVDDLNTEVICDRIHLCDDMLKLVFTKRSLAHVQMITDSLRCSHCEDGYAFEMGGLKVALKGGEARLVEGGNLAGSTLWMCQGLKNVRDVTGLPLKDLVRVTSYNQAIELGLGKQLGKVEKGYIADLAVLDPKTFKACAVFVNGVQKI